MSSGLQVNLAPEVAAIVVKEAARLGVTADAIVSNAIRHQYALPGKVSSGPPAVEPLSRGPTLADRFAAHIGVIDSSKTPGGGNLSTNTGEKFAEGLLAKHRKRQQ